MLRRSTHIILLISVFLAGGCATSGKRNDKDVDLDLGSTAILKVKRRDKQLEDGAAVAKNDMRVPPTALTNWRSFFKAPPTARERSILEERLKHWHDGGTAETLVNKGRGELALGRIVAAETSLRQALRLDHSNHEAMLDLASLFLRTQRINDCFDILGQAKDAIRTSEDVDEATVVRYRYTLALAYIARGDHDKGHKVLSDLIGTDKSFAPAYATLAQSYLAVGRDAVAEFVVRRGLDRVDDSAILRNLMGVIMQRQKHSEEARQWFDKAIQVAPGYVPALVNRAVLNTENMEYGAAEQDLLHALSLDPQNSDALVALGIVQKRQGNVTAAKESFGKAIEVSPENAHARFNLAVLMVDHLKRPNDAVRLFREVVQTGGAGQDMRDVATSYLSELQPGIPR